jgi:hypothetical protein
MEGELDALVRELERTAKRIETCACLGLQDDCAPSVGVSPQTTVAAQERSTAAAQAVRALRLGALATRYLRRRDVELEASLRRDGVHY